MSPAPRDEPAAPGRPSARPRTPSRDGFAALLAGLDPAARRRFVADLYRARGCEVAVRAGRVRVEPVDGAGASRDLFVPGWRHLFVSRLSPFPAARQAPLLGRSLDVDEPIDAVVVAGPSTRAERLARHYDAELLVADDLYEVLVHGVDPTVRDELCRRYFDRSAATIGDAAGRSLSAVSGWPAPGRAFVAVVAIALIVVGLVVGPAGVPSLAPAAGDAAGQSTSGSPERTQTPTDTTRGRPSSAAGYPAGIDESGVIDALAVSGAHSATLQRRSYAVTVWRRVEVPNGTRRTTIAVRVAANASAYHYVLTETTNGSLDSRSPVPRIEFWYDEERSIARYVRSNGSAIYGVDRTPDPDGPVVDPTDYRRITLAFRAFDAQFVGSISSNETVYYLLRSSTLSRPTLLRLGDFGPSPSADSIRNATFAAWVSGDGVVHRYVVGYDTAVDGRRGRVTHAVAFTAVGETTVQRPAWFSTAIRREGGEQSANGTGASGAERPRVSPPLRRR